jgi:hypothetical protein
LNMLVDGLPDSVEIGGERVRINTDFRTGILFEEAIADENLSDLEKIQTVLGLYYPDGDIPLELWKEAIERAAWFYRGGRDKAKATGGSGNEEPCFSYEYDADYVYAAFLQSYGIDLTEKSLHWWQFNALFKSLPEDTQIMKIIGYRTMKIPAKMSKDQKAYYRRMKEYYALPHEQTQIESDLTELLMKGGNPSELLEQGEQ